MWLSELQIRVGWLNGCFGLNGPLRQYFSLYRAVSQREVEKGEKMSKHPPHRLQEQWALALLLSELVGRPGKGSLPSTIAPPDHPLQIRVGHDNFEVTFLISQWNHMLCPLIEPSRWDGSNGVTTYILWRNMETYPLTIPVTFAIRSPGKRWPANLASISSSRYD